MDEMKQLLTRIDAKGQAPTDQEVALIVGCVDRRGGSTDGAIDKLELKEAILEYRNYKAALSRSTLAPEVLGAGERTVHRGEVCKVRHG